ncbi:MAG: SDR family NAD(P)-dependent oxidoreductase [Chloroflexota bacterium]
MKKLDNKVAIITGGGSGIGLASAHRFADEGAQLVLFGRDRAKLDQAAKMIDTDVLTVAGDMAQLADLDRLVAETTTRFGQVDVLFLNAGNAPFGSIEATDEALFDTCFNVNVRGRYFAIRKFLPHLNTPASIILTATGLMGVVTGYAINPPKSVG